MENRLTFAIENNFDFFPFSNKYWWCIIDLRNRDILVCISLIDTISQNIMFENLVSISQGEMLSIKLIWSQAAKKFPFQAQIHFQMLNILKMNFTSLKQANVCYWECKRFEKLCELKTVLSASLYPFEKHPKWQWTTLHTLFMTHDTYLIHTVCKLFRQKHVHKIRLEPSIYWHN